jgi:ribosomal protein L11 methylase PrmA
VRKRCPLGIRERVTLTGILRTQAPAFRSEISRKRRVRADTIQSGVRCCSMYWRMMPSGAPPQDEAK